MWERRASLILLLGSMLVGCQAAGGPAPSAMPTATSSPVPTVSPTATQAGTPAPTERPSLTASPSPSATPAPTSAPVQLAWVHGRLPKGLEPYEAGGDTWTSAPVFGGLAFGWTSRGGGPVRWRWSADGTRWHALKVPSGTFLDGWLQTDGTESGAFAFASDHDREHLWRTVDHGRTWRLARGVPNWPSGLQFATSGGRYVAVSDDLGPLRLFTSDDGWSWSEVLPVPPAILGSRQGPAAEPGSDTGQVELQSLVGDALGFAVEVLAPGTDISWGARSSDGRAWKPSSEDSMASAPEFVVWEWVPGPDAECCGNGWRKYSLSRDGLTWTSLGEDPVPDLWFEERSGDTLFVFAAGDLWSAEMPQPSPSVEPGRGR